ncbi:Hypothetical predicted protein [Mytilus galloprovincialis]|uniref:SMP-30/Gluconolactonase/LRE-like region domain-containing protein n=1 Tax=Mytilus galloprovincialis TaxID=29158 RepID=A0A8B6E806_MYTGA|nr:Hypothetical predicted protein [Mytilus galloprovincialis]
MLRTLTIPEDMKSESHLSVGYYLMVISMVPFSWKTKSAATKVLENSLWTFQHHDIDGPEGIALDKNGFVYIASRKNNRIVVVSPDGKTCKTILSDVDGINYPVYIDINRETGMMIVSSKVKKTSAKKNSGDHYHTAIIYKI